MHNVWRGKGDKRVKASDFLPGLLTEGGMEGGSSDEEEVRMQIQRFRSWAAGHNAARA